MFKHSSNLRRKGVAVNKVAKKVEDKMEVTAEENKKTIAAPRQAEVNFNKKTDEALKKAGGAILKSTVDQDFMYQQYLVNIGKAPNNAAYQKKLKEYNDKLLARNAHPHIYGTDELKGSLAIHA